jgi:hypothetical protein
MKKINTFWNWFQDNNQSIKNLIHETPKNQKHISFWINKNLSYYCKEMGFVLVLPKNPSEKSELIITANGNLDNFRKVIDLVDSAPKLRTWKFSAFIKPSEEIKELIDDLDEPYVIREIGLKESELKFLPLGNDVEIQNFDIIVYLKNYNLHCNTKNLKQAIFIILMGFIDKKLLYKNISFVQLAQILNQEELIHLYDFHIYIDS